MKLQEVINFSDAMIFAMALPNALGMYILARGLKADLRSYWAGLKSGEIAPYVPSALPGSRSPE